jgi:hypothetical protein
MELVPQVDSEIQICAALKEDSMDSAKNAQPVFILTATDAGEIIWLDV